MSELSPQAWAVLNAAYQAPDDGNATRQSVAAALRAAADQVVPMALCVHNDDFVYVRNQFLAIADELESLQSNPLSNS
ncbi:MAG: hypothetical protein EBY66_00550 [Candidatus Fonsibacter lacus]|nr:hypothetical protein [Candidatus Fonsibacter lacus]